MKNINLKFLALSGFLGSALMFAGDMLLYYEPVSGADYDSVARMSEVSIERLIAGGAAGPLASILSAIGGYLFCEPLESHPKDNSLCMARASFSYITNESGP